MHLRGFDVCFESQCRHVKPRFRITQTYRSASMNIYDPQNQIITRQDVIAAWLVAAVVYLLFLWVSA
jgi:hypothetical protein